MKIYTKTGDSGSTSLYGGKVVKKHDLRVDAYGTIDELNSFVGLLKDHVEEEEIKLLLNHIQKNLFSIGTILSSFNSDFSSEKVKIEKKDIENIELEIDRLNKFLPELNRFIIPGGNKLSSYSHVCRSICRRAERKISALNDKLSIESEILSYINRLSDLFFILSRYLIFKSDSKECYW